MKFPKGSFVCFDKGMRLLVQVVGLPDPGYWSADSIETLWWYEGQGWTRMVVGIRWLTGEARELADALLAERARR